MILFLIHTSSTFIQSVWFNDHIWFTGPANSSGNCCSVCKALDRIRIRWTCSCYRWVSLTCAFQRFKIFVLKRDQKLVSKTRKRISVFLGIVILAFVMCYGCLATFRMSGRDIRDVCQQAERSWASKVRKLVLCSIVFYRTYVTNIFLVAFDR